MLQKETPAVDYKENWDRACIRMALGRRSNGLLLDFCKVENLGLSKLCSAVPNKQTCPRRFFHSEEERVPYLGHFAAADRAVSSARVDEWAI